MRKLNKEYRGINKTTDVLSFNISIPEISSLILGDIVINVFRARKQAIKQNIDFYDEVYHLLIHGILHLLGFEHECSEEEFQLMKKKEDEVIFTIKKMD